MPALAESHRLVGAKQLFSECHPYQSPVSSMDWKKNLTRSRKDAKNTCEATGFPVLPV